MLCQIAATINLYIQRVMKQSPENREDLLMALRNQKCTVYDSKILTSESQSKANEFYDAFAIDFPVALLRKDGKLIPE